MSVILPLTHPISNFLFLCLISYLFFLHRISYLLLTYFLEPELNSWVEGGINDRIPHCVRCGY